MRNCIFIIATISLLCISCKTTESLYNGNVGDWTITGGAEWSFSSDIITGQASGELGYITTNKEYENFDLTLKFFPDETVNSGIFVNCNGNGHNPTDCYEINIWDNHANPEYKTGSIVTKAAPISNVSTGNKWNTCRIKSKNGIITAWVNGTKTAQLKGGNLGKGHIALQAGETGSIKFQLISIKEL